MKQTKKKIVWLVAFLGISSIQVFGKPFAVGPYLGQTPPGPTPQIFAPGLISDTRPHQLEGWTTFSADGNTFCFQRNYYVYITENTDQGWTSPQVIKSIPYKAISSCLSPDANSIYFTRSLLYPLKKRNLYRCNRTLRGWATPEQLGPPLSSPDNETSCSIAANNNIYLCSGRKGGDGKSGIWVVPFVDNSWPRAIHLSIDHPLGNDPGIAPDESFMVFYSIRPGAPYPEQKRTCTSPCEEPMGPGQNLGIWALRLIPGIMNTLREYRQIRNTCSSPALTGGVTILIETRVISTGSNSRNIYTNPTERLRGW